jgi:hypothetical protein
MAAGIDILCKNIELPKATEDAALLLELKTTPIYCIGTS